MDCLAGRLCPCPRRSGEVQARTRLVVAVGSVDVVQERGVGEMLFAVRSRPKHAFTLTRVYARSPDGSFKGKKARPGKERRNQNRFCSRN